MIKKGANIPDADHVMRYVSKNRLRRDESENIIGVLPQAFQLRPNEDALSVTWIDHFVGDKATKIKESVHVLRKAIRVTETSAFAIGNVGGIKEVCIGSGASGVRIVYAPSKTNLAHSGIKKLPRDDAGLRAALAAEAFTELVKNSAVASAVAPDSLASK